MWEWETWLFLAWLALFVYLCVGLQRRGYACDHQKKREGSCWDYLRLVLAPTVSQTARQPGSHRFDLSTSDPFLDELWVELSQEVVRTATRARGCWVEKEDHMYFQRLCARLAGGRTYVEKRLAVCFRRGCCLDSGDVARTPVDDVRWTYACDKRRNMGLGSTWNGSCRMHVTKRGHSSWRCVTWVNQLLFLPTSERKDAVLHNDRLTGCFLQPAVTEADL